MNTRKKYGVRLLALALLLSTPLTKAIIECEPSTGDAINTMVMDRFTGDVYVGLASDGGDYAVTKISKPADTATALTATAIGDATEVTTEIINYMNISYSGTTPRLVFQTGNEVDEVTIISADGATAVQSGALEDANGDATTEIHALAAGAYDSKNWIIAAVDDGGTWGVTNAGVIAVEVTDSTLALTPGTAGATIVSNAIAQVDSGGNNPTILDSTSAATRPTLIYDDYFKRFYLGLNRVTTAGATNDEAISVVTGRITNSTTGAITLDHMVSGSDLDGHANTDNDNILFATTGAGTQILQVHHLGVMHTSTSHHYLIVNGDNGGNTTSTGTGVYALPLVDDSATAAAHGCLADVGAATTFDTLADISLNTTDLYSHSDDQAKVGAGPLPIDVAQVPSGMQVVGDCVYVSIGRDYAAADEEGGIFYSRPMFDEVGHIAAWTRWEKAAPNILGEAADNGNVAHFAVDANSGRIFASAAGANTDEVNATQWQKSTTATTLEGAVNVALDGPCYSMYTLGRASQNHGNNSLSTLALFGGVEKVIFTRPMIRTADPAGNYALQTAGAETSALAARTDFSAAADFLSTSLPSGAGAVNCLGFNHDVSAVEKSYFFAGTDAGLYALNITADGKGGSSDSGDASHKIDALNSGFFADSSLISWVNLTGVSGSVTKIVSRGNATYVLARDTGTDGTITDTIYQLENTTDIANWADGGGAINTIASSGGSSGITAALINDIAVVRGDVDAEDQVIAATCDGAWVTQVVGGVQALNMTEALALWTQDLTDNNSYPRAFGTVNVMKNNTVWGSALKDDANSTQRYIFNNLLQTSCEIGDNAGAGDTPDFVLSPTNFTNSSTNFLRLDKVVDFWTDGGRRFITALNADGDGTTGIQCIPFHVGTTYPYEWNVSSASNDTATVLANAKAIYCCQMLPNGMMAAGTDDGIVVLS